MKTFSLDGSLVVYDTTEAADDTGYSQGICIKDSCDRFTLVAKTTIPDLIEILVKFMDEDNHHSVQTPFSELIDD